VIVPVLNERPRVGGVLQQLRYLDLNELGLVHEIIVVDGGSNDGSAELLRSEPDITLLEVPCKGRGDAIRAALPKARGEYVVVFPSDNEYDVTSITQVLRELRADQAAVVLGSRALGGSSAGQRLREVYDDNRLLYLLSHWGGVAVTLLLMLRLDRVVSDPLSGVRGACRDVFQELDNDGSGLDYDVRWVRRAVSSRRRIIEVPATYSPRSWRDGKKTTVWDGFRALSSTLMRNE
jgi:dolichol-phosphate mannosyltransferase